MYFNLSIRRIVLSFLRLFYYICEMILPTAHYSVSCYNNTQTFTLNTYIKFIHKHARTRATRTHACKHTHTYQSTQNSASITSQENLLDVLNVIQQYI